MKTLLLAPSTPRLFVVRVTVGIALLQALWIAAVPPFRASDEFDHAFRAGAVADGHWRATEHTPDGRGHLVRAPEDIVAAAHDQCASLDYTGPDNCNPVAAAGDGHVWVGSGAGLYNPAFYWVVGTAADPFEGADALYAMRAAGAALCLVFLAMAAWSISRARAPSWAGVGLILALTPVFLFSTAMAAPNGLEMASAVALWCALMSVGSDLDRPTERGLLVVAIISAIVLATLRLLGPMFVVLISAFALAYHRREALELVRRHRLTAVLGCLTVGSAVGAAAAWSLTTDVVSGDGIQGRVTWPVNSLLLWPLQSIAAFPYRDTPGPLVVYPVVGLAVLALVWRALRVSPRADRAVLLSALVAALLLPVVLTALTKGGRGVIWQGRYGLALGVGFVVLAGLLIERHSRNATVPWRLVVPGAAVLAAVWTACLAGVVRRELDRVVSSGDPAWHEPPMWLALMLCGLAWGLFAAAVGGSRHDGRV